MSHLSGIVSALPLGAEIGVGTSDNCKDCAMGWESFALLLRLLILWQWL
jgi:hypothetical protein